MSQEFLGLYFNAGLTGPANLARVQGQSNVGDRRSDALVAFVCLTGDVSYSQFKQSMNHYNFTLKEA